MRALALFPLLLELISPSATALADLPSENKQIVAIRVNESLTVDGILNETIWQRKGNRDFTQRDPNEGQAPTESTKVWFAYDDAAFYVAARLYDSSPDSIIARLGRRDADLDSDWFIVGIDSYHDKRSGFYFGVNPAGSIADGTLFNDESDDDSWDGVWDTGTNIDEHGWSLEMRIPYSQLRFQKLDEYVWGINCLRRIERRNEEVWLVMVPKKESGGVSRYADLVGIRDIDPPKTLEILPYVASSGQFLDHEPGDPFKDGSDFTSNLGADIKWGLSSNLTLNATFNPDFGQVEIDPAVVNLTQFETFFPEKRPFFIESSNFFSFGRGGVNSNWSFNWGNPDHFYSRRIGRPPQGEVQHEGFEDIPDRTTILGAAKLTGRISDQWTLGAIQAFTAREYGKVDSTGIRFSDVVEPLASYSVVRTLGEFNEGRQGLGFIGTALARDLNQPYLLDEYNRNAFTFGLDGWTRLDEDQTWALNAWLSGTHIRGTKGRITELQESHLHYFQRPDADHLSVDSNATSLTGLGGRVMVNKQKGNWQFNSALGIISPSFDSNDFGRLRVTDVINGHVMAGYEWFAPDGTFREKGIRLATFRSYNFGGDKIGEGYFLFWDIEFMNYWGLRGDIGHSPAVLDTRNTRGGPSMATTNAYHGSISGYTDSRKAVNARFGIFAGRSESGGYIVGIDPSVEWKPSSGLYLRFSPEFFHDVTIAQWVDNVDDPAASHTFGSRYIFGRLDQKELSASIRINWTFTPKLSVQLYIQPLISVGRYTEFKELAQPGTYTFNTYGEARSTIKEQRDIEGNVDSYEFDPDGKGPTASFSLENPDFNFKSLRGNAVLRWEYLPGSTFFLVWTHGRTNEDHPGQFRFNRDFSDLLSSRADNVFLAKIAYWINP